MAGWRQAQRRRSAPPGRAARGSDSDFVPPGLRLHRRSPGRWRHRSRYSLPVSAPTQCRQGSPGVGAVALAQTGADRLHACRCTAADQPQRWRGGCKPGPMAGPRPAAATASARCRGHCVAATVGARSAAIGSVVRCGCRHCRARPAHAAPGDSGWRQWPASRMHPARCGSRPLPRGASADAAAVSGSRPPRALDVEEPSQLRHALWPLVRGPRPCRCSAPPASAAADRARCLHGRRSRCRCAQRFGQAGRPAAFGRAGALRR